MENRPKLEDESAWKKLNEEFVKTGSKLDIYTLLKNDPKRFDTLRLVNIIMVG